MNTPQATYTPGPWEVVGRLAFDDPRVLVRSSNGIAIAVLSAPKYEPEISNAHLVAAAPDLLTACRMLQNIADTASNMLWNIDREEALRFKSDSKVVTEAIAKAEGRS